MVMKFSIFFSLLNLVCSFFSTTSFYIPMSKSQMLAKMNGKGFGGGEATRDPLPTPYNKSDPKSKEKAIFKAETYEEYMKNRKNNNNNNNHNVQTGQSLHSDTSFTNSKINNYQSEILIKKEIYSKEEMAKKAWLSKLGPDRW